MTPESGKTVEGQNLAEHMALIRQDIQGLRDEVNKGLEQRVTHAEINSFYELHKSEMHHIVQRVESIEHTLKEREGFSKKAFYSALATIVAAVVLYGLGLQ